MALIYNRHPNDKEESMRTRFRLRNNIEYQLGPHDLFTKKKCRCVFASNIEFSQLITCFPVGFVFKTFLTSVSFISSRIFSQLAMFSDDVFGKSTNGYHKILNK